MGGSVVRVESAEGGYSPGVASSLFTADGRAGFLKAVHPSRNPRTPALHRSEIAALAGMPPGLPVAGLIDALDQGDDGWVALLVEHVEGQQAPLPWTSSAVDEVLQSLEALAVALTPAPLGHWTSARDLVADEFGGWPGLAEHADLDPWLRDRLPQLDAAARRAVAAAEGNTVLHLDLRADNLMQRPTGQFVVVDWAWAMVGAAWLDPVLLAGEFITDGESGLDVDAILVRVAARYGIDEELAVGALVGLLASYEAAGRRPEPPGLPTIRAYQRRMAADLLGWLRTSPLAASVVA